MNLQAQDIVVLGLVLVSAAWLVRRWLRHRGNPCEFCSCAGKKPEDKP